VNPATSPRRRSRPPPDQFQPPHLTRRKSPYPKEKAFCVPVCRARPVVRKRKRRPVRLFPGPRYTDSERTLQSTRPRTEVPACISSGRPREFHWTPGGIGRFAPSTRRRKRLGFRRERVRRIRMVYDVNDQPGRLA
jgi:hypothetical protein